MAFCNLPAGIQDMLPKECRFLSEIRGKLKKRFEAAGYEPVLSAALEYYDTYAKIGNAVPQDRMFKLSDTDGRLLVLRPDATLSISRMAATKIEEPRTRLYYFSDKWDLKGAGGISSREIYQAGVERLGEEGAFSDAQTVAFAVECLKDTGLRDFIVDIGHVGFFKGILEDCGLTEKQAEEVRGHINRKDGLNAEKTLRSAGAGIEAINAVLALPTLFGGDEVLDQAAAITKNKRALSSISHLKEVYRLLCAMGMGEYVRFDLGTVRRLSYYSGMVFSGLVKELGSPVLSGGRYDNLADDFGKHIPAVGFAIGLKRLLIALERQEGLPEAAPVDYIIVCEKGAEEAGYSEYCRLIASGARVRLSAEYGEKAAKRERGNGQVIFVTREEGKK